MQLNTEILENLVLLHGSHGSRESGVCAMEAVAWVAGEPHSDHPSCACPVLSAFLRAWNDGLPDDETRTRLLKPYVARLVGTRATAEAEESRAWLAMDWLVRVCAPAFLRLTPSLADHARVLSGMPPVTSREIEAVLPKLNAAWAAARNAARNAARAAAWAAAGDAAWAAAGAAARDAAWAAAWAAARAAARAAAGAAAGDAAWAAAGAAARAAARNAAALHETVKELQTSAQDLLDRMIAVGDPVKGEG